MTLEPTPPEDLPEEQPAELQAINEAIAALEHLDDLSSPNTPAAVASVSLAWSNIALAIADVNRNAAASHAADITADWLANPSSEGFTLLQAAVAQYLRLR